MYIYLPQEVVDWVDRDLNKLKELVLGGGGKWSRTVEKRLRERTLFLVWYVVTRRLFPAKGDNGKLSREKSSLKEFVNIHRDELVRYGGSTHYYSIRKFLEQIPILVVNESYSTGQPERKRDSFTKGYRLVGVFHSSRSITRLKLSDPHLLRKLTAAKVGQVPDYLHRYRREVLSRVSLSEEAEESLLASQGDYETLEFYRAIYPVYNLRRRDYLKLDKEGRLYHPFNSLDNSLRRFLRIDNRPEQPDWVEVDVSACYFFIFGAYLALEGHRGRDLERFNAMASGGNLYTALYDYCLGELMKQGRVGEVEELEERYGGTKELVKKAMLRSLNKKSKSNLSASNKHLTLYRVAREFFPTVFGEVERLNREDNVVVYRTITRLESSVMVEYLVPRALDLRLVFITRHDGVICQRQDAEAIRQLILQCFRERLGREPNVKLKCVS
ncbi:hypothetical protein [uncultured Pontibacter sp.]|uniref:hypothetical protein n=1 Tax=uncultured Pontibacter sp. TaxID=453356 RepID=UPI0026028531|nr:hypothetical protein [uncultured Pontibacter sp.]